MLTRQGGLGKQRKRSGRVQRLNATSRHRVAQGMHVEQVRLLTRTPYRPGATPAQRACPGMAHRHAKASAGPNTAPEPAMRAYCGQRCLSSWPGLGAQSAQKWKAASDTPGIGVR